MLTNQDKYFIDIAFESAKNVPAFSRARVAAVLTHKNRILTIGYNHQKSSPFQAQYAKNEHAIFYHAETHAIKQAINIFKDTEFLRDCTLYVARAKYKDDRKLELIKANAEPCSGCSRCIIDFGIKRVVWTCDNQDKYGDEYADEFASFRNQDKYGDEDLNPFASFRNVLT